MSHVLQHTRRCECTLSFIPTYMTATMDRNLRGTAPPHPWCVLERLPMDTAGNAWIELHLRSMNGGTIPADSYCSLGRVALARYACCTLTGKLSTRQPYIINPPFGHIIRFAPRHALVYLTCSGKQHMLQVCKCSCSCTSMSMAMALPIIAHTWHCT